MINVTTSTVAIKGHVDIPGPHLVGRSGNQARPRVSALTPLQSALARFAPLGQGPVHGADRAKIPPLVEELRKDRAGGLIGKRARGSCSI